MSSPLAPDALADRLADVYAALGPVYRKVSRIVELDQPIMGMSVGVRAVLDHLLRDGRATVPELARLQGLSRQFVQRMVNDARAAGFVVSVPNPAHRRSSLIELTPGGREAIEAVAAREHGLMARVGGGLTGAELDGTLRVLEQMREALEKIERER